MTSFFLGTIGMHLVQIQRLNLEFFVLHIIIDLVPVVAETSPGATQFYNHPRRFSLGSFRRQRPQLRDTTTSEYLI